ncbi:MULTISPECIES: APC family permease [unclassified Arthrobacter]|uniref:APC family permease n=1 Tax=unclassified Arthrobacter TaxID=235627 RepID=UPI001F0FD1D6|nr:MULTISPECIES: APC family permease [unclassified Arthrobacter]
MYCQTTRLPGASGDGLVSPLSIIFRGSSAFSRAEGEWHSSSDHRHGGLASGQPFFNDINPRRTVPRAIMLVALIGGGIFVAVSYVTQRVHPGGVFEDSASAASSIALQIGGQLFGAVFLAGLVVAQFASGLAAQASASRLLYAMGRDSVLPKAVFGRLSEKFHTPVPNLVVTGVVGLIAVFLDVATSTSFINFGAFTAFTLVNASVVFHYVRQRRAGQQLNRCPTWWCRWSARSSAPTCCPSWTAMPLRWGCPGWRWVWWSWPCSRVGSRLRRRR